MRPCNTQSCKHIGRLLKSLDSAVKAAISPRNGPLDKKSGHVTFKPSHVPIGLGTAEAKDGSKYSNAEAKRQKPGGGAGKDEGSEQNQKKQKVYEDSGAGSGSSSGAGSTVNRRRQQH